MILGYKYIKGYQVDEERACQLAEVEPTPAERLKSVMVASRVISRDDYMTTAIGYRVNDPNKVQQFVFVLDFGDDCDELLARDLHLNGKDSLLHAAEHVLSGPFVYVYVN
jgi:hypothetical protein